MKFDNVNISLSVISYAFHILIFPLRYTSMYRSIYVQYSPVLCIPLKLVAHL